MIAPVAVDARPGPGPRPTAARRSGRATLSGAPLAVDLRPEGRQELRAVVRVAAARRRARRFLRHRQILPGRRRLSSAGDERRAAARIRRPPVGARGLAGLTPSGRAIVPASWALYDFANTIFSFAVVSGAIGLYLVDAVRRARRERPAVDRGRRQRRDQRPRLADPRRVLGPRRRAGCRSCCSSPRCASARRSSSRTCGPLLGLVLFIVANFAYQAALIYYDATLKTVSYPATRGKLSGLGTGIGYCGTVFVGLLIFFLDVPVADRFRLTAILFLLFAIPIFVFVREPRIDGQQGRHRRRHPRRRSGSCAARSRTPARCPGSAGSSLGRFFYSDAVNTVIVVMSIVTREVVRPVATQNANLVLLLLTAGRDRDELRVGRAVRPAAARSGRSSPSSSRGRSGSCSAGSRSGSGRPGSCPFLIAGAILGSGLGGVQVADRVLMVRLSPPDRIGEFFGIYGLVGKGSQVIGQLLYGLILFLLLDSLGNGAYQVAVLSLLVTMLIGLWLDLAGPRRLGRLRRDRCGRRDGSGRAARAARRRPAAPLEPR